MNNPTPKDPRAAFTINGVPYTADGVPVEEAGKRKRKGEKRPFLAIKAPNSGVQVPSSRYSGAATRQPDAAKRPANTRKAAAARKPDKKRQPASTRQSGASKRSTDAPLSSFPPPDGGPIESSSVSNDRYRSIEARSSELENAAYATRRVIALSQTYTVVVVFLAALVAIFVLTLFAGALGYDATASALAEIDTGMLVGYAILAVVALVVIRILARNVGHSQPWEVACGVAGVTVASTSASNPSKRRTSVSQMFRIAHKLGVPRKDMRPHSGIIAAVLCTCLLITLFLPATELVDYLNASGSSEVSSSSEETTAAVTADEDTLTATLQEIGGELQEVCTDVYVEDPEEYPDSTFYTVSGYVDDERITEVSIDLNADGSFSELYYVMAVDPDDDLEDAIDQANEQLAQLRDALAQTLFFEERPELIEMSNLPDDYLDQFRDVGSFEEGIYYDEDYDGGYSVFAYYSDESDGESCLTLWINLYD